PTCDNIGEGGSRTGVRDTKRPDRRRPARYTRRSVRPEPENETTGPVSGARRPGAPRQEWRFMRIAIGGDHAGYPLKEHLVGVLSGWGHAVDDLGTDSTEAVDYPPFC